MGLGGVGKQALGVKNVQFVNAIRQHLLFNLARNAAAGTNGLELNASVLASLRPLVRSSRLTSSTVVPSISQYTNTLFMFGMCLEGGGRLSDGVVGKEFLNEAFHIGIRGGERFALLGFEHDVLHGLYLGGRAGQTALRQIGLHVSRAPLRNGKIGLFGILRGVGHGAVGRHFHGRHGAFCTSSRAWRYAGGRARRNRLR